MAHMGSKGYVLSCLHQMASFPKGPGSVVTCSVPKPPKCGYQGPGHMLRQVIRRTWTGGMGGEILLAHGHCGGVEEIGTVWALV
jgi:hypothetical protein